MHISGINDPGQKGAFCRNKSLVRLLKVTFLSQRIPGLRRELCIFSYAKQFEMRLHHNNIQISLRSFFNVYIATRAKMLVLVHYIVKHYIIQGLAWKD